MYDNSRERVSGFYLLGQGNLGYLYIHGSLKNIVSEFLRVVIVSGF